jgi:hypothetical protein
VATSTLPRGEAGSKHEAFVSAQLERAEARIRNLDLAAGVLGFLALTLVFAMVMVFLDARFDLPLAARQLALVGYLVLGGIFLALFVVRPLRRRVNPYYAALQVERTLDGARNCVVNWLDMEGQGVSAGVRGFVSQRTAKSLQQADIDRAISGRRAGWMGGITSALAVLCVIVLLRYGGSTFFHFLARAFAPVAVNGPPTLTQLTVLRPDGGNAVVPNGRPVTVLVQVDGKLPPRKGPEAVKLRYRYHPGEPYLEREMTPLESGRQCEVSLTDKEVQNGFWYRIKGGDAETAEYRIDVRAVPLVTEFRATYNFRPYTALNREVRLDRKIDCLRGTEVVILARTNRILRDARLEMETKQGRKNLAWERVPEDPTALRVKFVLDEEGSYRLAFTSVEEETYIDANAYPIVVRPDQPPTVELIKPGKDITLPSNGLLQLEGTSSDDIGVKSLTLKMKLAEGRALQDKPYRTDKDIRLPSGGYPLTLAYKDFVDLAKARTEDGTPFALKAGMELEYWLEAADACDYPKPNVTQSKHFKVKLTEPEKDPSKAQQQRQQAEKEKKEHDAKQDQDRNKEDQNRKDQAAQQEAQNRQNEQGQQGQQGQNGENGNDKNVGEKGSKEGNQGGQNNNGGKDNQQRQQDKNDVDKAQQLQDDVKRNEEKKGKDEKGDGNRGKSEGGNPAAQSKPGGDNKEGADKKENDGKGKPEGQNGMGEKSESKEGGKSGEQGDASKSKEGGHGMERKEGAEGKGQSGMEMMGGQKPSERKEEGKGGAGQQQPAEGKGGPSNPMQGNQAAETKPQPGQGMEQNQGQGQGKGGNPEGMAGQKPSEFKEASGGKSESKDGGNPMGAQEGNGAAKEGTPTGKPADSKEGGNGKTNPNDPGADPARGKPAGNSQGSSDSGSRDQSPPRNPAEARPEDVQNLERKLNGNDPSKAQQAQQELEKIKDQAKDPNAREAAKEALDDAKRTEAASPKPPGSEGQGMGQSTGMNEGNQGPQAATSKGSGQGTEQQGAGGKEKDENARQGQGQGQSKDASAPGMGTPMNMGEGSGQATGKGDGNRRKGGNIPGQGTERATGPDGPHTGPQSDPRRAEKPLEQRVADLQLNQDFWKKVTPEMLRERGLTPEQLAELQRRVAGMKDRYPTSGASEVLPPHMQGGSLPNTGSNSSTSPTTGPTSPEAALSRPDAPPGYRKALQELRKKLAQPMPDDD